MLRLQAHNIIISIISLLYLWCSSQFLIIYLYHVYQFFSALWFTVVFWLTVNCSLLTSLCLHILEYLHLTSLTCQLKCLYNFLTIFKCTTYYIVFVVFFSQEKCYWNSCAECCHQKTGCQNSWSWWTQVTRSVPC